jgi:hypothetical protein
MPTASRQVRRVRRIRRERTLALRYARAASAQRDQVIKLYNEMLAKVKEEANPLTNSSYEVPTNAEPQDPTNN